MPAGKHSCSTPRLISRGLAGGGAVYVQADGPGLLALAVQRGDRGTAELLRQHVRRAFGPDIAFGPPRRSRNGAATAAAADGDRGGRFSRKKGKNVSTEASAAVAAAMHTADDEMMFNPLAVAAGVSLQRKTTILISPFVCVSIGNVATERADVCAGSEPAASSDDVQPAERRV